MEKDLFVNEVGNWNYAGFGMEIENNELNCTAEPLSNCIFNPNWDNSMDQSDPFESAMSSIVSSPATSNAGAVNGSGDNFMIREVIGRLGNICNSGNNSTNTSCYNTPLNSPPKLNLSMVVDPQMRGNLTILGRNLPTNQNLTPFAADPGFAERAARFSCFGSGGNLGCLVNGELGTNESDEFPYRSMRRIESGQSSFKFSQMGVEESSKILSRCSTPENAEMVDSVEGSSLSEQIPGGEKTTKLTKGRGNNNGRKRKSTQNGEEAKAAAEKNGSNAKRIKHDEALGNENDKSKTKEEPNADQKPPEPPKDYIHVRARRGQATDSHSLAERVRREKISKRMKFLQDLVPGCNKVTGKAVMLDEIINYVQSLQRQVEFLSMKLATVNPRMDLNIETLLPKDIFQSHGSSLYPSDSSVPPFSYGYQPLRFPSSLNNGVSTGTDTQLRFPVNSLSDLLRKNPSMEVPLINGYGEPAPQVPTFWEDDLQSVVQMGLEQNQQQSFQGSMDAAAQMKTEQ